MRINENIILKGSKVVLVPYKKEHVLTYHDWMKDPFLQETTASEPLSLEEEYEMQQSWLNDDQKCTFILLSPDTTKRVPPFEIYGGMVGDINLYFNDHDSSSTAEIEIMIAEKEARGKGIGQEALAIMIEYSITQLHVEYLISKIGFKNQSSLNLFSKFGFVETSRSEIFQEVTLQLQVDSNRTKPIYETIQIN